MAGGGLMESAAESTLALEDVLHSPYAEVPVLAVVICFPQV